MSEPSLRPTLQDLLRVKRAEQPSPQFWADFDRELRVKQLAAMVEKRPWWCSFPRAHAFLLRQRLPLAAAAAAVVGFGTYGYHRSATATALAAPGGAGRVASAPAAEASAVAEVAPPASGARSIGVAAAMFAQGGQLAASAKVAEVAAVPASPAVALLDSVPQGELAQRFDSSLGRALTANLAGVQAVAPELARNPAELPRGMGARFVPASAPVAEPLAQMPSPAA